MTVTATEAKVSKRVLKRYVPIYQENAVDNDLLADGARNLRDYFQSRGYFDVTVDYRTLTPEADLERVEFAISQGTRYKLVHISITGNKYFDEETIRERMFLEPASFHLRQGRYSEAFVKKDEENITNLYRSSGFRDVKIVSETNPSYRGKPGQIGVVIRIEEGPQWSVDHLTVEGLTEEDRKVIEPDLASASGQPFAEVNIAADRNRILNYYTSRGFVAADFKGTWQVTGPNHVNVIYAVTPGQQEFVRRILITGLKQTRLKLINQRITLKPRDPLSDAAQRNSQRSLYDMGVFARVDTAIENPDGDTTRKQLLYAFQEANRYTLSLGVGAQVGRFGTPSSEDLQSPGGATGFSPLFSANLSRLNFLGIGHTISVRGVYSSLEKRISANYFAPRFQNIEGRSLMFSVLWDQSLNVTTFGSKRKEARPCSYRRSFRARPPDCFRFAYRDVSVNDVVIPVLLIPQLLQSVRIGILSANLVRDRRDNPGGPHPEGSYTTAEVGLLRRSTSGPNATLAECFCGTPHITDLRDRLSSRDRPSLESYCHSMRRLGLRTRRPSLCRNASLEAARIPYALSPSIRQVPAILESRWSQEDRPPIRRVFLWEAMLFS